MIHFFVEMEDLTRIEAALGMAKDKSKMVLKTAINNTAKQLEKSMAGGAQKRYKYKRGRLSDIREANSTKKATTGRLYAIVAAEGKTNELLDFHVRPSTYFPGGKGAPKWVKARVLRSSSFSRIALRPNSSGDKYKAFVIRYKNRSKSGQESEHFALAQRVPGKRMESNPRKEAVKSLLSISTPKMEEMVYKEEIASEMYDILQRNIQEQIARYVKSA